MDADLAESLKQEAEVAGKIAGNRALRVIRGKSSVILEIVDLDDPENVNRVFLDPSTAECLAQNIQESARYLDSNSHECTTSNPFVN